MSVEISIIIPTINRYEDLYNTLNDLKTQTFQNYEILIIDQTDKEKAIEVNSEKTRYFWKDFKSASKARNVALLEAHAPIILYLDDDVIINNKDFIQHHLSHFKNPKVAGVSGAILNTDEKWATVLPNKAKKKYLGWIYFPRNYNQLSTICDGGAGNLSVRKDWAIAIGGMDENYDKGAYREESDFCLRYTKKYGNLIYDPKAYLVHIGNPKGGTRSWKNSSGIIHAKQHMFGAWYFMFKRLPFIVWPEYSYLTVRRFIFHKKLLSRFYLLPLATIRFSSALCLAVIKSLKKPKFIIVNK